MNKQRRKQIEKLEEQFQALIQELEEILNDEQEYLDSIPENLQGGERYSNSENAIAELEEAKQYFEDGCAGLANAIEY